MFVSSEYCEKNLPLLITILECSEAAWAASASRPVVRSNAATLIGDMLVCFNHLIDRNTELLYRCLNDGDESVEKTGFLTLNIPHPCLSSQGQRPIRHNG
jgi:condensin complex subunit 1